MISSRALIQLSPTSARTDAGPVSTSETRVPTRTSAPAASARLASARSNATRSITAASGVGVEYGILSPDGDTNCAVVKVFSVASCGRPRASKLSLARMPVQ